MGNNQRKSWWRERTTIVQMNCDTSSLKAELKQELTSILAVMQQSLLALDQAEGCLLGTFDEIRSRFSRLETTAASFYLQCYLAPYSSTYTDLSLAVSHLAQKRQGALVVMEREDSVAPFLQAGIPIGAVLSHSLLESIFFRAVRCTMGRCTFAEIRLSRLPTSCRCRRLPSGKRNWERGTARHWDSASNATR